MHPYHHPTYIIYIASSISCRVRTYIPLGAGLDQPRVGDHVGAQPFPLDGGEHLCLIVVALVGWWVVFLVGCCVCWVVSQCWLVGCIGWCVVMFLCWLLVWLDVHTHARAIGRVLVLCCGWYTYTYPLTYNTHPNQRQKRPHPPRWPPSTARLLRRRRSGS